MLLHILMILAVSSTDPPISQVWRFAVAPKGRICISGMTSTTVWEGQLLSKNGSTAILPGRGIFVNEPKPSPTVRVVHDEASQQQRRACKAMAVENSGIEIDTLVSQGNVDIFYL